MNYIKELKAFKDWKLLNDLPTSAIALWYTLMSINNMTGWKEWFTAPNSTLQQLTNLSKQGLDDARNKLMQKDLILYRKGNKKQAGTYKIVSLVNSLDLSLDQNHDQSDDQTLDQGVDQSPDNDLDITKHKHKQDIYTVFEHWNEKGIVKHRELNQKRKSKINARLEKYSLDDILQAIDNYAAILESDRHYYTHKFNLERFLDLGILDNFLTENKPFENYLKKEYRPRINSLIEEPKRPYQNDVVEKLKQMG